MNNKVAQQVDIFAEREVRIEAMREIYIDFFENPLTLTKSTKLVIKVESVVKPHFEIVNRRGKSQNTRK